MNECSAYVGLDVHKDTTAVQEEDGYIDLLNLEDYH